MVSNRAADLGMGLIATVAALVLPPVLMMIIFTPFAFAFIGAAILPLVNTVMLISVLAVFVRGAHTGRPWFAAAPFVFVALWISAAVASRAYVFATAPNEFFQRDIPERAKGQRTLILLQDFDPMLLANGSVDRIITHQPDSTAARPVRIKEFTLGRGEACPLGPTSYTRKLWVSGRMDECILETPLQEFPADGLEIRSDQCRKGTHRCHARRFILWDGRKSEVIGEWYTGSGTVLSYLPLLNMFGSKHRITVWGTNWNGPLERVYLGPEPIAVPTITQILDQKPDSTIAEAQVSSPQELLDKAYRQLPQAAQSRALREGLRQIAELVQKDGVVDKRSFAIMATAAGDYTGESLFGPIEKFAQGLSQEQQALFREEILRFLADKENAEGYSGSRLSSLPGGISTTRLDDRLLSIFSATGLADWQYEVVARVYYGELERIKLRAKHQKDLPDEQIERNIEKLWSELFKQIEHSEASDLGPRMAAYCRVFGRLYRPKLSDREKLFISVNLVSLTDQQFDRVLFDRCLASETVEVRAEIYARILARTAQVIDPDELRSVKNRLSDYEPKDT